MSVTLFKVLKSDPYKFKQNDLFHNVHINKMGESQTLKVDTYKLQRSELCSLLGWGIWSVNFKILTINNLKYAISSSRMQKCMQF